MNALESRIDLISDDDIPVLSCRIVTHLTDGTIRDDYRKMTATDYACGFNGMTDRLKKFAAQEKLDSAAVDVFAAFNRDPTLDGLQAVISAFRSG